MLKASDIVLWPAVFVFGAMMLASLFNAYVSESFLESVTAVGGVLLPLMFVLAAWRYLFCDNEYGHAWKLLSAGMLLWAAAEFLWYAHALFGPGVQAVSVADAFWVLGYVPLGFGLYYMRRGIFAAVLNRSAVILPLVFVFGLFILYTYLGQFLLDPSVSALEKLVGVFYPIGDIVLFLIAVDSIVAVQGGKLTAPWLALSFSFTVFAVADAVYEGQLYSGAYTIGGLSDMLYYFAYFFSVFAVSEMIRVRERISRYVVCAPPSKKSKTR
jgi:hypothetical protein